MRSNLPAGSVSGRPDMHALSNGTLMMRDAATGELIKMDLSPSDVHVDAALSNFITGYRPADMLADEVSPPVVVDKASDFYFQFDPKNALQPVAGTNVAPGVNPPEVNPQLSRTRYQTEGYALASVIPVEVSANQDAPLNVQMAATQMIMDLLMLNREIRVANQAFTTANYASASVLALNASQKWNGGSASDPVDNIRTIVRASLMPVTGMIMSLDSWHAFTQNPAVQKYVAFKSAAAPLPQQNAYDQWAALLDIPRPYISQVKALSGGVYSYVWTGNVVLFRVPPGMNNINWRDIPTFKTFRWNGAGGDNLPTEFGGTVSGGWTVRSYYNPFRGKRGSYVVVVAHDDAEQQCASQVGGIITGTYV